MSFVEARSIGERRDDLASRLDSGEDGTFEAQAAEGVAREDEMGQRGRSYILQRYQRRDLAWQLLGEFADLTGLDRDARKTERRNNLDLAGGTGDE